MKKTGFFTLFFIFLCIGVWGGDYTWTGGGSDTDWTNPANWDDGSSYPGNDPTDTVIINSGSGTVTLDDNIVLTSIEIDGTDLDLDIYSLTADTLIIKNNVNLTNSAASSLVVDTLNLTSGSNLTGDLTADNVTIDDSSTLNGTISFSGGGVLEIDGVTDNVSITGTGTDIVCGNLDLGSRNVSVTQSGSGGITQNSSTVIKTSGKLSLSAAGAITLTETNKVAELEITGAGGTVQFTNSVALDVGGISGVGSNDITITVTTGGLSVNVINSGGDITFEATADITVGIGGITVTGVVKMEGGGNITVSGKITAYQLIAKAPTDTVSINAVEINSSNMGNERENAAIYIVADSFAVTTTTANSIIPGGTGGQLCLTVNTQWTDINGVVDGIEGVPGTLSARWHQHIKGEIFYSFTEDSDGNGRLDRIRVQSNNAINGDFSNFDVTVEGYVIDRTKGTNGFQMVSDITGKTPFDNDSFYIYLKENPDIDGGNTPLWSVIRNTSLLSSTGSKLGDPAVDKNIKPIDTIPPRIAYTLTIPGNPQTYMQMSEPVVSDSGVVSASFDGVTDVNAQSAIPANLGYLFNYSNSYGVDDLAPLPDIYNDTTSIAGNGYFKIENIADKEPKPNWSVINPACPPKYPLNWGYTEYAKVINDSSNAQSADSSTIPFTDVFTPPNKLLTVDMMTKLAKGDGSLVTPNNPNIVIRRVTDVMISMAPATANSSNSVDDNYFVWPVWAKPSTVNTGTIWQFDGTAYLERDVIEKNNGIELQARIKNSLTGNLEFFWTTVDIPADRRNPKEATEAKKVGGLWLPNVSGNPRLYYYVLPSGGINKKSAVSSSALFNFDITADSIINGGMKFEFIFRLTNSDMFTARLDAPPGIIPSNWYALIRPFSFDIQSMRQQRGGVTIMNNVINSDKKETAYIRYNLTRSGSVTIQIYTLDGTLVKSIKRNEKCDAGTYVDTWDGSNNGGRAVARGMYFVRVVGPDIDEIRKIMVVK